MSLETCDRLGWLPDSGSVVRKHEFDTRPCDHPFDMAARMPDLRTEDRDILLAPRLKCHTQSLAAQ